MLLNCGVGEDSWEFIQPVNPKGNQFWIFIRRTDAETPNTLATWCKELTRWKRPRCWERLIAGGEEGNRGWYGWMASLIQWTWVWVNSGSWWWTGRPAMLQSMGLQRVGHNWVTELNLAQCTANIIHFLSVDSDNRVCSCYTKSSLFCQN